MYSIRCYVRIRPALLSSVGAFKGSDGGRRGKDDPWNDVGELGMSGEDGLRKASALFSALSVSLIRFHLRRCGWKRKRE